MEEPLRKGDVVVLFPFSDLSGAKKRPAIVITALDGDDVVLCQVTSEARFDSYSITLKEEDFRKESLHQTSIIRPNRIFTADKSIISYRVGSLKEKKKKEVEDAIVKIVKS